jgi:hypothetical protein
MDEEQLQIRASALAHRALTRITRRAWTALAFPPAGKPISPQPRTLRRQEIGDDWDFRVTLDVEGKVYVFMEQYRGRV